jgi:hypothetical protein
VTGPRKKERPARRSWDFPDLGGMDLEGLLVILGVIVAIGLGWAIVELLAPVLLVCAYVVLVAALRRVANDRHGCEGNLGRSILWGALWATVYTLPLAAVVALGHLIAR